VVDADAQLEEIEVDADEQLEEIEVDADEQLEEIEVEADAQLEEIGAGADVQLEEIEVDADEQLEEIEVAADEQLEETEVDADEQLEEIEVDADEQPEEIGAGAETQLVEIEVDAAARLEETEADADEPLEADSAHFFADQWAAERHDAAMIELADRLRLSSVNGKTSLWTVLIPEYRRTCDQYLLTQAEVGLPPLPLPPPRVSPGVDADWFISLDRIPTDNPSPLATALRALRKAHVIARFHFDGTQHAMLIVDSLSNTYPTRHQISYHLRSLYEDVIREWSRLQSFGRATDNLALPAPIVIYAAGTDTRTAAWFRSIPPALLRAPVTSRPPTPLQVLLGRLGDAALPYAPTEPSRHHAGSQRTNWSTARPSSNPRPPQQVPPGDRSVKRPLSERDNPRGRDKRPRRR
jgi:hypothetical protein